MTHFKKPLLIMNDEIHNNNETKWITHIAKYINHILYSIF